MNLESPKVTVHKSQEELFKFLSDVKNFEHLMPENISKQAAAASLSISEYIFLKVGYRRLAKITEKRR